MISSASNRIAFRRWCVLVLLVLATSVSLQASMGRLALAQDDKAAAKAEEAAEEAPADEGGDAAAKADNGAGEPAVPGPAKKNQLQWLLDASGPFGILIILESVVLVAMIVMAIMQLRRDNYIPAALIDGFERKMNEKDYPGAYELVKADDSLLGKTLTAGMGRLAKGYDEAMEGMSEVIDDETLATDHKLSLISLIGTTAPMLGLLGTVQGMVGAFTVIANSVQSPKPNELAQGIILALVTTLEGLIVAIPAVIAFSLTKNRQARLTHDTASVAEGLMSRFATLGKKPSGATATTTSPAGPSQV